MLIESDSYARNRLTGDIVKRQRVQVKCDFCPKIWTVDYDQIRRRRKAGKGDQCQSCCSKRGNKLATARAQRWVVEPVTKVTAECQFCGGIIEGHRSRVENRKFCSIRCTNRSRIANSYNHLYKTFDSHPDEVAYLCGLILGDGHERMSGVETTQVLVAFDDNDRVAQSVAARVLRTLRIRFWRADKPIKNCRYWNFVLPNDLLQKHSMLWRGDKIDVQPIPVAGVTDNINFAAGLINSDGCCSGSNGYDRLSLHNAAKSIVAAYKKCLRKNGISFTEGTVPPRLDSRTGNWCRESYVVNVGRREQQKKLRDLCKWQIKKSR